MVFSKQATVGNVLSKDCIDQLYGYLSFTEIESCCQISSAWSAPRTRGLYQRIADTRWSYRPRDYGMGAGVPLVLDSRNWKAMVDAREAIETGIANIPLAGDKVSFIVRSCCHNSRINDEVYFVEAMRWITELFDLHTDCKTNNGDFPTPEVPVTFLIAMSLKLKEYRHVAWLQQLTAKCVGVLCICERNRVHVQVAHIAENLVATLSQHSVQANPGLMATALWSCVILCRPIGGVEGQTLTSFASENFRNVRLLAKARGVDMLFNILRTYAGQPNVLSKAFWLIVNLALVEEVKADMIKKGAIKHIIAALRMFEGHKDLQHRACFSLINLGIRPEAKQQILEQNGLELVFAVMRRYANDPLIQRVGCNVWRSLIFGDNDQIFVHKILELGGMELLQGVLERFSENEDVASVVNQTIFWLEHF